MASGLNDDDVSATSNGNGIDVITAAASSSAKPKRVRTGCLTCRERHLKCDEGQPICMNCRKSQRPCKRGVRLNFIDTQCQAPPQVAPAEDWSVSFMDESLDIASEYKGGLSKYQAASAAANPLHFDPPGMPPQASMVAQPLPPMQGIMQEQAHEMMTSALDQNNHHNSNQSLGSASSTHAQMMSYDHRGSFSEHPPTVTADEEEKKDFINDPQETLYMQVFVEEVGLWMDSMDPNKTFGRILPFHALSNPMLMNAFLACGVRHLTLVNPSNFSDEKAIAYYETASRALLTALQNPQRDSVICATTAVILNVYEIMTEKPLPRMSHIAGSRALIRECNWDARSYGVGAACFWLNVGLETLSNIRFNWKSAWEPDKWGLDMNLAQEMWPGREDLWTHRMLYITAKVSDFRASVPKPSELNGPHAQALREQRYEQWFQLKHLCDTWSQNIPRTMHLMAYLHPYQTQSRSAFPEIWLIKRTTIVAQLFYNTAMCLLARTNPLWSSQTPEMQSLETHHAHIICGISAHVKDRGVASVALRSLAVAAESLTNRREQEEVLDIFARIHRDTGWRIGFIPRDLRKTWGWEEAAPPTNAIPGSLGESNFDQFGTNKAAKAHAEAEQQQQQQQRLPPQGIVNPMFAQADFTQPRHPYQDYYVAPYSSANTTGDLGSLPTPVAPTSYGYQQSYVPPFG